jgi:hypothetical protein
MNDVPVEFVIFSSDGGWKLDRNNEFVAVFSDYEAALDAAEGYVAEIRRFGGVARVVVRQEDGSLSEAEH